MRLYKMMAMAICMLLSWQPVFSQPSSAPVTNGLPITADRFTSSFIWLADTSAGMGAHAAILVAVSLPGCSRTCYMQFDLGAQQSVMYRNQLKAVQAVCGQPVSASDTITDANFTFLLNGTPIPAGRMPVINHAGPATWQENNAPFIIGTLGADVIDGRVMLIDYPSQRLTVSVSPPDSAGIMLSACMYVNRSVLLPAVIKGKKTILFFDTGSSAFELLTDRNTYTQLADTASGTRTYQVRSWNRMLTAHMAPTRDSITTGGQRLPLKRVTYMEGASDSQVARMMQLGIGGMTGNTLFLEKQLLIDTRTRKFAVLDAGKKVSWQ